MDNGYYDYTILSEYAKSEELSPEVLDCSHRLTESFKEQLDVMMHPELYDITIDDDDRLYYRRKA